MTIAGDITGGLTELADDLAAGRPVRATTLRRRGKEIEVMATTLTANRTGRMPRKPRATVMKPEDFRAILEAAKLTTREAAEKLGVGRGTVSRWQTGETPIAAPTAKLIRAVFKLPKK